MNNTKLSLLSLLFALSILLIPGVFYKPIQLTPYLKDISDGYNWNWKDIWDRFLDIHLGTTITTIVLSITFIYYSDLSQGISRFAQILLIYCFIYSIYNILHIISDNTSNSIYEYSVPFIPSVFFTLIIIIYHFAVARKYNHSKNEWTDDGIKNTSYHKLLNILMILSILIIYIIVSGFKLYRELDGSYTLNDLSNNTFKSPIFNIDNLLTLILSILIFFMLD